MKTFLIIDDDQTFCNVLASAVSKKDFEVRVANNSNEALLHMREFSPEYVLLDLRIQNESGLQLLPKLIEIEPYVKIVVLTGFASVSTAVEAIKLGAVHYLTKPVDAIEIIDAFDKNEGDPATPVQAASISLHELESRHIKLALDKNNGNISATARELKMHRRTLQRKLDKSSI